MHRTLPSTLTPRTTGAASLAQRLPDLSLQSLLRTLVAEVSAGLTHAALADPARLDSTRSVVQTLSAVMCVLGRWP